MVYQVFQLKTGARVFYLVCTILLLLVSLQLIYDDFVATTSLPLSYRIIVVDAGHGGPDPGTVRRRDPLYEKDITLSIAKKLRIYLQQGGAIVVMTRETDSDLADPESERGGMTRQRSDLTNRVKLVQESGAEAIISIHVNALPSAGARGAQAFFAPGSEEGFRLARTIQDEMIAMLPRARKTVKSAEYFIVMKSPVPAVIVEVGFISNPTEANMLNDPEYQDQVAWAIYRGITRFFAEAPPTGETVLPFPLG